MEVGGFAVSQDLALSSTYLAVGITRSRALADLVIANHVVSCSCAVPISFFTLKRTIARAPEGS